MIIEIPLQFISSMFIFINILLSINIFCKNKIKISKIIMILIIIVFAIIFTVYSFAAFYNYISTYKWLLLIQYFSFFVIPCFSYKCDFKKIFYLCLLFLIIDSNFSSTITLLIKVFFSLNNINIIDVINFTSSIIIQLIILLIMILCKKRIIFINYNESISLIPTSTYILMLIILVLNVVLTSSLLVNIDLTDNKFVLLKLLLYYLVLYCS